MTIHTGQHKQPFGCTLGTNNVQLALPMICLDKEDFMVRCPWGDSSDIYRNYHDREWGVPVTDDNIQFEFLLLESAQAGLSWITILKKRENYRKAYDQFDPARVCRFGEKKKDQLLANAGIIRNRRKIEASFSNAKHFLSIQKEFGSFSRYIWRFTDFKPVVNRWKTQEEVPANSALSDEISKDLKKRGFAFLGSTIIYAHLQATGLINDHIVPCFRYKECIALAREIKKG